MNKRFSQKNLESLFIIANRLEELCEEVTFVGGSIIGLLITEKAAPDVRFTYDVDCIIDVITYTQYYSLEKKLKQKGFKQDLSNNHPICRWTYENILLDVVPIDKKILGFTNKWYKDAIQNPIFISLPNSIIIKIISAPYFLATKLEAFKDRGGNDYILSYDLEDIISVLDGRTEIVEEIAKVSDDLKEYLSSEFSFLIRNQFFMQALPGHVNYTHESEYRKIIVEERIKKIINLIK